MQTQIKMLVFDMDGTLFDTMGALNVVAQNVMQKHYGLAHEFGSELYKKTSGLPFRYQLEKIFPKNSANDVAAEEFEATKRAMYQKPVTPFPEVVEHLKLWKDWGYKIAVSSNDEEANVKIKMGEHVALADILLGHRPGFLKGKAHFDELQNKFGLSKNQMLFVGDSLHDGRMADENGIPFVGRLGTFSKDEFLALNIRCDLVKDFFELHGLLQHKYSLQT